LHTASTHFDHSISETISMWSLKDFFKVISKMSNFQGGVPCVKWVTNFGFGQNKYFSKILCSIIRKSLIKCFSVKSQTNILEQFLVFRPLFWPFFGWIYKIICKKYKIYGNFTNHSIFYCKIGISIDFWHFQSDQNPMCSFIRT
jgi:hypothetical protein